MESLSDIKLVTQVAVLGDKRAFDKLVKKYQSPVRRFLLNLTLGDEQLSDDLAQDTFIQAYTNISSFRGLSGFKTWLFRIAYNTYYSHQRRRHDTEDLTQKAERVGDGDPNLSMDVYDALARLKPDERTCITLQLIDGYPIDKIAAITGLKANTVKSHLARGKEKLATFLKKNGYDR